MKACVLLGLLATCAAFAQEGRGPQSVAPGSSKDPLVGHWIWHGGNFVTVSADGTAVSRKGARATWRFLDNKELERKYEVIWDDGVFIDTMRMSRDGKKLTGKNQKGERVSATIAPPR